MNPAVVQNVIQIGSLEAFFGIAALLVGMGTAWGLLKKSVDTIENTLSNHIVPDLKNARERLAIVEDRMGIIWGDRFAPTNSPRRLNEYGSKILFESGIRAIADEYADHALEAIQSHNPSNAYDAEKMLIAFMSNLPKERPELAERLKNGAFRVGADIDALFFVGAIYLRDKIFPTLGFSLNNIT